MPHHHSVLIIEDRKQIAYRLEEAVSSSAELTVCGVATTLDQGLQMLFDLRPRVALVDLGLPDGSGVELIRASTQVDWPCDSLVISVFGDEKRVLSAIQAGAKGYILKGGSLADIGTDVMSVINGGSPISPAIARHLLRIVNHTKLAGQEIKNQIHLTSRERETLEAVAKGYKRQEIAKDLDISIGTVGNHINNIYRKLEVGSNIEAVLQATKMGLL